jgi:dihydropteroate synthase
MGVLNVTPDSFSDGGRFLDRGAAIAHGLSLIDQGADIVDVGGESTRPGASPVSDEEELDRVIPVITALAGRVRVSVDTTKPAVASAAVSAGATLINDVSASLWSVAAAAGPGVGWVAMHRQGTPETMQDAPSYDDVVAEVRAFLASRVQSALAAGVVEVWVDPGIGFGKTLAHNLTLLAHLGALVGDGAPVMVGTSRKSFITKALGAAPVEDRLEGSLASAVWALSQGAAMVRVHDVAPTVAARSIVEG